MLYQFVKYSFVAPSITVTENSNIFEKNCLYPKTFYLNRFLLLTSTALQNLHHPPTRNCCRNCYTLKKELSSLTREINLPIFTANKALASFTQYELSLEELDLLKAALNFTIQPDKIQKSEIFTTFEKIHRWFLNNLKSEEFNIQIKAHHSYLGISYF